MIYQSKKDYRECNCILTLVYPTVNSTELLTLANGDTAFISALNQRIEKNQVGVFHGTLRPDLG